MYEIALNTVTSINIHVNIAIYICTSISKDAITFYIRKTVASIMWLLSQIWSKRRNHIKNTILLGSWVHWFFFVNLLHKIYEVVR
jgi:hypothetical protein